MSALRRTVIASGRGPPSAGGAAHLPLSRGPTAVRWPVGHSQAQTQQQSSRNVSRGCVSGSVWHARAGALLEAGCHAQRPKGFPFALLHLEGVWVTSRRQKSLGTGGRATWNISQSGKPVAHHYTLERPVYHNVFNMEMDSRGAHRSLSAATRDRKTRMRCSKGTHWGASLSSAASAVGRPPDRPCLQRGKGEYVLAMPCYT